MPKQKRPGVRTLYVELDEHLGNRLEALAEQNRRTLKGEVVIALERHLASAGVQIPPGVAQAAEPPGQPTVPPRGKAAGGGKAARKRKA